MSRSSTRVALYGKSTTLKTKNLHKNVLNQIEPTEIPKEFICSINLHINDDHQVTFEIKDVTGNFCIEEVKDFLIERGVNDHVSLIEITIDLDAIADTLTATTNSFLEKYFDN